MAERPGVHQPLEHRLSDSGYDDGDLDGGGAQLDAVQAVKCDAAIAAKANAIQPSGPSFDGSVSVVNSSCQFGGNTFYHGPVTVVLPDGRSDADVVLTAAPPGPSSKTEAQSQRGAVKEDGKGIWRSLRLWQRTAFLAGGLVLVLTVCLTSTFFVARALRKDADHAVTVPPAIDASTTPYGQLDGGLLVSRRGWGAEPPKSTTLLSTIPVNWVIIHHTGTATCSEASLCQTRVRDIQITHKYTNSWDDIGYNFLVGGDGHAYEGRGWYAVGAHTHGWNSVALGVALIGNFCITQLPAKQLNALQRLLRLGEELGKLSSDYTLVGKCQLNGGGISPGTVAMQSIMALAHWGNMSVDLCSPCYSPRVA